MKALLAGPATRPRRRASVTSDAGDGEALPSTPAPMPPPAFAPRLEGWAGIPSVADAVAYCQDTAMLAVRVGGWEGGEGVSGKAGKKREAAPLA